jgi:hypothetical protein
MLMASAPRTASVRPAGTTVCTDGGGVPSKVPSILAYPLVVSLFGLPLVPTGDIRPLRLFFVALDAGTSSVSSVVVADFGGNICGTCDGAFEAMALPRLTSCRKVATSDMYEVQAGKIVAEKVNPML